MIRFDILDENDALDGYQERTQLPLLNQSLFIFKTAMNAS